MLQAIELAKKAVGYTYPNPMVGCIITYQNEIIGEGYHQKYGEFHAEVNAINSVVNKELLKHSTLYVTLEPCSHYGKTPPCVDLILKYKIPNVVIGCQDPNPTVNGKGIAILKQNNVNVITNIEEIECIELNKRFFIYHNEKRPYVILKWAETADGFIFGREKEISSQNAKILNHLWRHEEHAIMVGKNTLISDNPKLNTRYYKGENPIRISFADTITPIENLNFFDGSQESIIFTNDKTIQFPNCKTLLIEEINPENILTQLYSYNIQSVIIEGGAKLLNSFINKNLFDEIRIIVSKNKYFKYGIKAPEKPNLDYQNIEIDDFDNLLKYVKNITI